MIMNTCSLTSFLSISPRMKKAHMNLNLTFLINLKMVKISNFHGYSNEILMVKFSQLRAVALEFLVLVAAVEKANSTASFHTHLCSVYEQLLLLPKASSKAQIMLH